MEDFCIDMENIHLGWRSYCPEIDSSLLFTPIVLHLLPVEVKQYITQERREVNISILEVLSRLRKYARQLEEKERVRTSPVTAHTKERKARQMGFGAVGSYAVTPH